MVSARGIAQACEFFLVDISIVQRKISLVDVDRDYEYEPLPSEEYWNVEYGIERIVTVSQSDC
jgi:hypothetical protein